MRKPGKMVKTVLEHVFKKPATIKYPYEKSGMPEGFRGELSFSQEKCIGCKMCMRDCPTGAINIKKAGEKQFIAEIDLGKCIYCGQCVDSCVKKALAITGAFELAQLDKAKLQIMFGEPDQNTKNPTV